MHIPAIRKTSSKELGLGGLHFWASMVAFLLGPVLFTVFVPSGFWERGLFSFAVSVVIFWGTGLLALGTAYRCLNRYALETRFCATVRHSVDTDLKELERDESSIVSEEIHPDRYLSEEMVASRTHDLLEKHYETAKAMRSDDAIARTIIDRELHPLRMSIRPFASLALRSGILMTFAGLLYALQPLATALREDGEFRNIPVGELMGGLTISFSTSIAGLAAALVIHFLVVGADSSFDRVVREMEDLSLRVRVLFARVRFGGDLTRTVDQLSDEINRHATELESHGVQFSKNIRIVVDQMRDDAAKTREVISAVSKTGEELSTFEENHRNQVDRLIEVSNNVKNFEEKWIVHFESILEKSDNSIQTHANKISDELGAQIGKLRKDLEIRSKEDRVALKETLSGMDEFMRGAVERIENLPDFDQKLDLKILSSTNEMNSNLDRLNAAANDGKERDIELIKLTGAIEGSLNRIEAALKPDNSAERELSKAVDMLSLAIQNFDRPHHQPEQGAFLRKLIKVALLVGLVIAGWVLYPTIKPLILDAVSREPTPHISLPDSF